MMYRHNILFRKEDNSMWILYAFFSAFFAGITAVLAKIGIKDTDSNVATAIRTIVILIFSWLMVFIVGSQNMIYHISVKSTVFLILSGLATGASWLCYFRALQLGNVNKVTPIDKSSTVMTMLLAFVFLSESITWIKVIAMCAIGLGTYFMIVKKTGETKEVRDNKWFVYAGLAAVFASLTSILGKIGITEVESNLGTAIRTIVVLLMAWIVVFIFRKQGEIKRIDRKSWIFLILSGITTGASWLFYYSALQKGVASVVVPIDKLSIVFSMTFSYFILKEKFSRKSLIGLLIIIIGTLMLLI